MVFIKYIKIQKSAISVLTLFVMLLSATCAFAGDMDFTIANGVTSNRTWTLDGGDTGTIEQGGAIKTSLVNEDAVSTTGNNNIVNNSGSLSTTGDMSHGINVNGGRGNTANNSGSIFTTGDNAHGIFVNIANNHTIYNSGSIFTTGTNSPGIILTGGINTTVYNSGSILTEESGSSGINVVPDSGSDGHTIYNTGTISAKGLLTPALRLLRNNNIVHNYGGIFATGLADTAIFHLTGRRNTLNIYPGSQIIGIINFDRNGDVINIFDSGGAGSSSTLMFVGTPTVNTIGDNVVNRGGPRVLIIMLIPHGSLSTVQHLAH